MWNNFFGGFPGWGWGGACRPGCGGFCNHCCYCNRNLTLLGFAAVAASCLCNGGGNFIGGNFAGGFGQNFGGGLLREEKKERVCEDVRFRRPCYPPFRPWF